MGFGIAIVKYFVFIFNLVFAIIGLALLVIGVIFKLDIKHITGQLDESFVVAPTLLIIVGAFIFILSFLGCCGAIKESRCMLITYAILLVIILVLQIVIGVFSFVVVKESLDVQKDVREDTHELFQKYNATVADKDYFDNLQQTMKCCGVDGPEDWQGNIPQSCCIDKTTCKMDDSTLFNTGCSIKIYQKIYTVVRAVGYAVFVICAIEIIGIFFAICLINSMKNKYRRGVYA